jgi:hypothetical protein
LAMNESRKLHASYHYISSRLVFVKKVVRFSTWLVLLSRNWMLKSSIFFERVGYNILGEEIQGRNVDLAMSVFWDVCRCIGK